MANFLSRYNRRIIGVDLSLPSLKLAEEFRKKIKLKMFILLK